MIYGYARVSTIGQERDGNGLIEQETSLREHGAAVIYKEAFTGTKIERPMLNKLLNEVKPGDTIIVTKLDRVSRTAEEGIHLVKQLMAMDVTLHILNMGILNNTPVGKLMVTMLMGFAEFERDMIVQRTMEGKAIARQRTGYKEGRKRKDIDMSEYQTRVESGEISVAEACRQLGISKQTWYNRVKESAA